MISDSITVKGIIWEDLVNYKKISTTLMMPKCSFKCDKEFGSQICQNGKLAAAPQQTVLINPFMRLYKRNELSEAIVLQGLEPLDSPIDVLTIAAGMKDFNITDDLVIYTGYNKGEVPVQFLQELAAAVPGHLIIKWGRYIPNQQSHYDFVLGINLASDNQYAEVIK